MTAHSPEQVVGHLKLREDGWEVTNSAQHLIQTIIILDDDSIFFNFSTYLTNHSVCSTQRWINLNI